MARDEPNWEAHGGHWFFVRVLRHLIKEYQGEILMGRYIKKQPLYRTMSWWFRCSREDTQEVLTILSKAFPSIKFSNQGLWISSVYLDPKNQMLEQEHGHKTPEAHDHITAEKAAPLNIRPSEDDPTWKPKNSQKKGAARPEGGDSDGVGA